MSTTNTNITRNGGPPCPKVDRLEELMEWLTEEVVVVKNLPPGQQADASIVKAAKERNDLIHEVITALDWTHTMLSNRKVHQKHAQLLRKAKTEIAMSMLSPDELKKIDEDVKRQLQLEVVK